MTTAVLWLRRDLRLHDHPALLAALEVLPLFVLDDALRRPSGAPRLAFLYRCLRELQSRTDGALRVLEGPPERVVPRMVCETGAASVHTSSDHGPYGQARDARVAAALPVHLVATGSPYAVPPGALRCARTTASPTASTPPSPALGGARRARACVHAAEPAVDRRRTAQRRRAA